MLLNKLRRPLKSNKKISQSFFLLFRRHQHFFEVSCNYNAYRRFEFGGWRFVRQKSCWQKFRNNRWVEIMKLKVHSWQLTHFWWRFLVVDLKIRFVTDIVEFFFVQSHEYFIQAFVSNQYFAPIGSKARMLITKTWFVGGFVAVNINWLKKWTASASHANEIAQLRGSEIKNLRC